MLSMDTSVLWLSNGLLLLGLSSFVCSLNLCLAEWSLSFTNVCGAAVVVTHEVLVFNVLSLGCITIKWRVLASLWYMCTLCDL